MRRPLTNRMNRKGFSLMSDIGWFIAFIIFALGIIVLGFRPLAEEHITNKIDVTRLGTDAQYTAVSISRISIANEKFTDSVRSLISDYDKHPADDQKWIADTKYARTLDDVFSKSFTETATYESQETVRIKVFIVKDGKIIEGTCKEYMRKDIFAHGCSKDDIPDLNGDNIKVSDYIILERGYVSVPTSDTPAILAIAVERSTGSKGAEARREAPSVNSYAGK